MSYQTDVEKFMLAGDQPTTNKLDLKSDQSQLYMNLITEEYKETLTAFEDNDIANTQQIINSLAQNAKILAATNLLLLCKQWQLNETSLHSLEKKLSQKQLLNLITQSVSHLEKTAAIID